MQKSKPNEVILAKKQIKGTIDENIMDSNQEMIKQTQDHQNIEDSKPKMNSNEEKESGGLIQFMKDFLNLYQYGQRNDKLLLFLGILLGLASGISFPLFTYFWGKEVDHINFNYTNLSQTLDTSLFYYVALILTGIFALIINGVTFSIWKLLSVNISRRFRVKYLEAFTKKSVQWIQKENLYEVSSQFKSNCLTIEKAIGDKIALFYNLNGILLAGSIAALCVRWTFTLYLFALLPIILGVLSSFLYVLIKKKMLERQLYKKAEGQTLEAFSLIKTVKMLGAQEHESQLFCKKLGEYDHDLRNEPLKMGITTGLFYFIQYLLYGIGYMFAIQCVRGTSSCPVTVTGGHYTMGEVLIVFFQLFLCSYNFLQLATNYEAVKSAIECSKEIFSFVNTSIQQQQEKNKQKIQLQKTNQPSFRGIGSIQLKNVGFAYPLNPEKKILQNISLSFLKNKFNAIVGSTGSGKSTIIQLLLKNYNPTSGQIFIDGVDLLNIEDAQLRSKIGYVGQEPTLFSGSISDNIRVGKEDATDEQIFDVLKLVNLYDFAMGQPQKLDFSIGFGGSKLSGGQRQRIAIARALVKKPHLLILDEATSALDRKSQKVVQQTIRKILAHDHEVTVICIAHRIKTISEADRIWYIEEGLVKDEGKFEEIEYFISNRAHLQAQQQDENLEQNHNEIQLIKTEHLKDQILKKNVEQVEIADQNIYTRLFSYVSNKKWYFIAIFAAFLNGINHLAGGILQAYVYNEILIQFNLGNSSKWCQNSLNPSLCESQLDDHHHNLVKILLGMIGFAFYTFFPYLIQITFMTKIQNQITLKIRTSLFKKLMVLPVEWHEREQNEGGQAGSRCCIDAKEVGGLITNYIPIILSNFCTILGGIIIPLCYNWKLGLLSLAATPLIAVSAYISMIFIGGYEDQSLHRYQHSNQIANELIMSIRTILSFNYQKKMMEKYSQQLEESTLDIMKRGAKIGLFYGSSVMVVLFSIGSLMYASANIIAVTSNLNSIDFVILFTVPVWSGWTAGNNFFFASHVSAGKLSAKNIFAILDLKSESSLHQTNVKPMPNEIKGKIQLKNVTFNYRNASSLKNILKNVSFVIQAGEKAAFVGSSGCGKTTIMQLLQRFYEYEGEILLDGVNILEYDLKQYREFFGVVNQQPSLFMGTLRQNITFSKHDLKDEEIFQACQLACAFNLTSAKLSNMSLKENILTFLEQQVGPKGSNISGGEKQRVAVARALLRKPQIFLMDEGTSALDRETEKRVQENLDNRLKGNTMINIAHRIETIENSDCIFLFQDGILVEQGKYTDLMKNKSSFEKFVRGAA